MWEERSCTPNLHPIRGAHPAATVSPLGLARISTLTHRPTPTCTYSNGDVNMYCRSIAELAQPDPIKTMVDLHKEGEDLASAQGILRLTGKHLHERAWIISAMFSGYMTIARRQLLGLVPELRHMNTEANCLRRPITIRSKLHGCIARSCSSVRLLPPTVDLGLYSSRNHALPKRQKCRCS